MKDWLKGIWVKVYKIVFYSVLMIPLVLWGIVLGKCDADCFNNGGHGLLRIQEVNGVVIDDFIHFISVSVSVVVLVAPRRWLGLLCVKIDTSLSSFK